MAEGLSEHIEFIYVEDRENSYHTNLAKLKAVQGDDRIELDGPKTAKIGSGDWTFQSILWEFRSDDLAFVLRQLGVPASVLSKNQRIGQLLVAGDAHEKGGKWPVLELLRMFREEDLRRVCLRQGVALAGCGRIGSDRANE